VVANSIDVVKDGGALKSARRLGRGNCLQSRRQFLYIANLGEQELATYRLAGDKLVPVGSPLKLPGHPASMRGSTP
jgi:hypothetical protein